MHELTKDVTIGDHKFMIARVKASDGAWLVTRVPRMFDMSPEVTEEMQAICLSYCFYGEHNMPVYDRKDKKFTKPCEFLANDTVTVMELCMHVIGFNLGSFFGEGRGLQALEKQFMGLFSLNSQA